TRYPECDWSTWDEPVARPCPNCDAQYLVKKSTKARGDFLRCQACYHEYTEGADDSLEPAGVGVPPPAERRAKDGGDSGSSGKSGRGAKKTFTKNTVGRKGAAKKSGAKRSAGKKAATKNAAAK